MKEKILLKFVYKNYKAVLLAQSAVCLLRWFQDLSIFEIRNDPKIESIIDQITFFYFLELFDIVIVNFQ